MGYIAGKNLGKYRDDWVRFVKRTKRDRGTYSNLKADDFKKNLIDLENENPSLLMIPTAGKDSKLYTYFPADGSADFTVSRNSTKWVLGKNGYLYEVPANQPAIRFNTDGSYRGVLVESQSTNILKQSNNLSSGWVRIGSDYTSISQVSNPKIISTENAWKIVPKSGRLTRYLTNSNTNISNDTGTASNGERKIGYAFIKLEPGMVGFVGFKIENDSSAGRWFGMIFDENQTNYLVYRLPNVSGMFRGIIPYPNGWFLCYVGGRANNSSNALRHFCFGFTKDTISNVMSEYTVNSFPYYPIGDGVSAGYFGGAQVENSTTFSSYIPTTNSISTRAADVITLNNASNFIPQTGKITIGWEQEQNDTMYVGALSASVDAGVRKLEFEYSPTYQKLYIDDTLQQTINGSYDWSDIDSISLGHLDESQQPSLDLKYFSIN